MLIITFTFKPINNHPDDFPQIFNSFYMTFSKPLFILALTMFLFPILLGRGKFIRGILGHDFFTPLARISFGAYLIHATFMTFEAFNRPRATWSDFNINFTMFFAWLFVSYMASFLFTIFIEAPCANLEKTFLMGSSKGKRKAKKPPKMKLVKVEQYSFANSFSETLVKNDSEASDSTPELSKRKKDDDDYWKDDDSPQDRTADSFVKNAINS